MSPESLKAISRDQFAIEVRPSFMGNTGPQGTEQAQELWAVMKGSVRGGVKGHEGNQGRLLGLLWVMVELWVPPQPCISSPALASCEAGKLRSWFSLWAKP